MNLAHARATTIILFVATVLTAVSTSWPLVSFSAEAQVNPQDAGPTFDPLVVGRGKTVWTSVGACVNCHGWAGNGQPIEPYPPGANLRTTELNPDQIAEVVRCGRPGSLMPYHDKAAYTGAGCYGLTEANIGAQKPDAGNPLRASDIEAVVAYVITKVKGRGPITKAECQEYYGGGSSCAQYN